MVAKILQVLVGDCVVPRLAGRGWRRKGGVNVVKESGYIETILELELSVHDLNGAGPVQARSSMQMSSNVGDLYRLHGVHLMLGCLRPTYLPATESSLWSVVRTQRPIAHVFAKRSHVLDSPPASHFFDLVLVPSDPVTAGGGHSV